MDVREMRNEALGKRVVKALESRNMEAYYVKTKEEAVKKALELIPKGSTINMGGSASVRECGLIDAVCSDDYVFYDRDKAATVEERHEIALKAFTSDWFLGSVNAMSEDINNTIIHFPRVSFEISVFIIKADRKESHSFVEWNLGKKCIGNFSHGFSKEPCKRVPCQIRCHIGIFGDRKIPGFSHGIYRIP